MTILCPAYTEDDGPEWQNGTQSSPEVGNHANGTTTPEVSPLLLPEGVTSAHRSNTTEIPTHEKNYVGTPSSNSSERKHDDPAVVSPKACKARRSSDTSRGSPKAGLSTPRKFKSDKKGKSKDGQAPHPKKALYFKLDPGYWYSAWPIVASADAKACYPPDIGIPRDRTPLNLRRFDVETILQTPIFSRACRFPGMDDLKRVYVEVAALRPSTSPASTMWNEGIANLVFLACELFLPKDLFRYVTTDEATGKEVEHKGPLTFYGAPLERNYLIAVIVSVSAGVFFTNKQISSHQQHTLHKLTARINDCPRTERTGEKRRLSEIIALCRQGSQVASESMADYIAEVAQLRRIAVKGKMKESKQGIPLQLHPLLAFFIHRNGSFAHKGARPENRLIDVSDNRSHHLPWPFAWGWYFFCKGESIPNSERRQSLKNPFGSRGALSTEHRYYSLSDIERSGTVSELGSP